MPTRRTSPITSLTELEGRWIPMYQEMEGQMIPPSEYAVVELKGDEFKILKNGTVAYEGRFTIDLRRAPMGIALIYTKSHQAIFLGGPRTGLFQLEGETLKWCFGSVGQAEPVELNTFPGSGSVLSVYQKDTTAAGASSQPTPAEKIVVPPPRRLPGQPLPW